nr:AraC family transcriptional regulator [uncultured Pseudomonas sp.]
MAASDLISELLSGMRLCGVQFRRLRMRAGGGIAFTNELGRGQFHFVARGPVWLHGPGGDVHCLESGDAVLLPRGGQHAILAAPKVGSDAIQAFDLNLPADEQPADPQAAILFSCCMQLQLGGMQPLVAAMPAVMRVDTLLDCSPEIRPLLEAMERESLLLLVGHGGILARLAEVVAALIVRGWVTGSGGEAGGWLGALHDPRLSKALLAMHRHPERPWTVASLASEAGQSRSVFAQRFLRALGLAPLRYLTDLRMRLAMQHLSDEPASVERVAEALGYGSLAAFSRAFKRSVGVSPGAVKRGAGLPARAAQERQV